MFGDAGGGKKQNNNTHFTFHSKYSNIEQDSRTYGEVQ